jgi:hypothetical protein
MDGGQSNESKVAESHDTQMAGSTKGKNPMSVLSASLVILLLGIIIVSLVLPVSAGWKVCAQQLSSSGVVASVCRPYQITDIPVICVIALLIIIGWRFVSQVGIPGVVTLTRRVSAAEDKANAQGARQAVHDEQLKLVELKLQQYVSNQATATGGSATSNNNMIINVNLAGTVAKINSKESEFPAIDQVGGAPIVGADQIEDFTFHKLLVSPIVLTQSKEPAPLVQSLAEKWKKFSDDIGLETSRPIDLPGASAVGVNNLKLLRSGFLGLFEDEITDLKLVLTLLSNGTEIGEVNLENAVTAVDKLDEIWLHGLTVQSGRTHHKG